MTVGFIAFTNKSYDPCPNYKTNIPSDYKPIIIINGNSIRAIENDITKIKFGYYSSFNSPTKLLLNITECTSENDNFSEKLEILPTITITEMASRSNNIYGFITGFNLKNTYYQPGLYICNISVSEMQNLNHTSSRQFYVDVDEKLSFLNKITSRYKIFINNINYLINKNHYLCPS